MKGVILAAGKGSRLYPVTHHIPKPLLPLANRPTMAYAFDKLIEIGVTDICVIVGENEGVMKDSLGDGSGFGISLSFARQTDPKGLAHALSFARDFCGDQSFVMYLGDAIYSDGFGAIKERFEASGCANLNLVKPVPDPSRFGVANVDGERIMKLVEKPPKPESNLAMAGLYFFSPAIWEILPDVQPSARGEYEITDAIQMLIDRGHLVLAGIYEGSWFDTGTLDSFLETSAFLAHGSLVDPTAAVQGQVGPNVVIGANAIVECERIEDSVVLPGSTVRCIGKVSHSLLGGDVHAEAVLNSIRYGAEAL